MAKEVQPAQKNASLFKSILSGCLGNVLEWYDYGLYGYFAVVISAEFFTSEDPVVGILMSFMVFGVGFVVRPIGGLIMGAYADKHGRVKSLTVTIMAIGICTMLMGCLPTYEQIGIMAPILLTVLRLLQGLATGGEFGSALTFISEFNNGKNTSFLVSWQPFSVGVGMLIGSITGLICTSVLSQPDLYAWGWRIPFLIGIVVAIYGVYLRKSVPEPPEFEKMKEQKKATEEDHTPVKVLFKKHWVAMITNIGLLAGTSVSYYLLVTYLPTYIKEFVGGTMLEGFIVNTAVVAVYLVLCPFAGHVRGQVRTQEVRHHRMPGIHRACLPGLLGRHQRTCCSDHDLRPCMPASLPVTQRGGGGHGGIRGVSHRDAQQRRRPCLQPCGCGFWRYGPGHRDGDYRRDGECDLPGLLHHRR